jgi:hypothetical protein
MVLALRTRTVSTAFGIVSFFMADGDRTVRVDVSQVLLARVGGPSAPKTKAEYERCLLRHRRLFAHIASAKYDEGQYQTEVNILVVRITEQDLA